MKKIVFFLPLVLVTAVIAACYYEPAKTATRGMVIAKNYFYNPSSGKYISSPENSPDTKMWFKDSMAIVESIGAIIEIDEKGHETREMKLANYTFVNLKTKSYYQYHSFTDTATIEKKFTPFNKDRLLIHTLMWNFFNHEIENTSEREMEINDTTINQVTFKRKQFIHSIHSGNENWKETTIAFYRCDKAGTIFRYGDNYSKQMECPMVKVQFIPLPPLPMSSSTLSEIVYISDTLTAQELKVFDAWEKNEKKYPIRK